ncbi:hypothetical protein PACTADRAFT_16949 [Pachysolen tannophilus NRRL Y-2460]|uniref:Importin N-terminal domain-containing protein n=1 Tax=Pachysolen tannophilus NRRL Y-2460 TaxID=669874 RepID=A0A1E4TUI6_PACTA|nr:hypothetical protein PACTADRAFT_16949 [Pachysolen tannophilus NRRL Y-2460]
MNRFVDLIVAQTSPDNQKRTIAEAEFNNLVQTDASNSLLYLIEIALNENLDISLRQSSILHVKRLVPKYWSASFESFIGPNCVDENSKIKIRQSLLKLLTNADSKIRNSGAYAIVQLASSDYPDEWPQLLDELYNLVNNENHDYYKMLGGLTVLRELFDDLVTEEQFFEGRIGSIVLTNCHKLLINQNISIEIKIETLKLFISCLNQLSNPEMYDDINRKNFVLQLIPNVVELSFKLLNDSININILSIYNNAFKLEIYKIFNLITSYFKKAFENINGQNFLKLYNLITQDLSSLTNVVFLPEDAFEDYSQFKQNQQEAIEPSTIINNLISEQFQILSVISSDFNLEDEPRLLENFVQVLIKLSILPNNVREDWSSDFNNFVTIESGLSVDANIRLSISEYLADLDFKDINIIFDKLLKNFESLFVNDDNANLKESVLYLLGSVFQNEEDLKAEFSVLDLLNSLLTILQKSRQDEILSSRLILLLPRFLEKFSSKLDPKEFAVKSLLEIINNSDTNSDLVKSSILFSFTYFNQFIKAKFFNLEIQNVIIRIISNLFDEADEDTNITLLEALSIAIAIDNKNLASSTSSLELIFNLIFKDPSNFGLIVSGKECLEDLFKNLTLGEFSAQCEKGLPILLNILEQSTSITSSPVEFSPELNLALEILICFIDIDDRELPGQMLTYIFPTLTKLILRTEDDQILQLSNEVLNKLLNHNSASLFISKYVNEENNQSGYDLLLNIVSKYLSPQLSDQATAKVGDLITTLIEKFSNNNVINQYLNQILMSVSMRLVIAKELPTIENLILIFSNLAMKSPQQIVGFLSEFKLPDPKDTTKQVPALEIIIPIWLQAFETIRGFDKILLNIKALIELFKLNDQRLNSIMVNSDELVEDPSLEGKIITRSMKKNLQYVQIPVPLKIIKLFINELKFQLSAADASKIFAKSNIGLIGNRTLDTNNNNGADDGWEDVDANPTFDNFRSYAEEDYDDDDDEGTDNRTDYTGDNKEELDILKNFFKWVGSQENFKDIFNYLQEDERKLLIAFVVDSNQ